ncbi:FMN-binding protein [Phototrophicus methaneseepsis]|uniref:FMN-binding protein n=1 Tax=Phototrophicus methaneseepsis TaxID=2710758 RepID=A0A7S8IG93_9CHLR|nr:FMN-binding protein [Phototrophicus methaneseepsis]QPC84481.1 FMN-binding protein [Phototrophicus methaneseepsis]
MANLTARQSIQQQRDRQRRQKNIVTIVAFLILVGAWIFGRLNSGSDVTPFIQDVLPQAERIEQGSQGLFTGYATQNGTEQVVGYAMTGTATGYGGPMLLLVGTDVDGNIIGTSIIEHGETPNFFGQLDRQDYYDQFFGANYSDALYLGEDIDGVSGATLSSEAVAQSIRQAVRGIASAAIDGAQVPPDQRPVKFGAPEVALIALFVVSFFLHRLKRQPTLKKYGRWLILLSGLFILGFVFNKPFTLSNVITLLSGYWPDWHTNLYWYLLVGGIILVTSIQGKNPYCSWFCPFGAAQEVLGSISGAKPYQPRQLYSKLRWVQRALSFTAIVLGLAMRQPGAASYEPFGTLFNLQGSWPQWVMLVMVLLGSLVIYRPFCNYLCPLDPVVDYIGEIRRWVKNVWRQKNKTNVSISSKPS